MAEVWGQLMRKIKTIGNPAENQFEYFIPDTTEGISDDTPCPEFDPALSTPLPLHDQDENEFDMPSAYSTLWEIQLELGEIPDMISNNLLKPCLDCGQQWQHCESGACPETTDGQPFFFQQSLGSSVRHSLWLKEEDEESVETGERGTSDCEGEYANQPHFGKHLFAGYSSSSLCLSEGSEDDGARFSRRSGVYPVYGVFDKDEGALQSDIRHDRKDSGVFVP